MRKQSRPQLLLSAATTVNTETHTDISLKLQMDKNFNPFQTHESGSFHEPLTPNFNVERDFFQFALGIALFRPFGQTFWQAC